MKNQKKQNQKKSQVPCVSVIVPVYNVESFIEGALKSLYASRFTDFECICVDDASTDRSGDIVRKFQKTHDHLHFIRIEHAGLSAARNAGLKAARGKYVFFLDSDDYLHPDALEELVRLAEESKADIVSGSYVRTTQVYAPIQTHLEKTFCRLSKTPLETFLNTREILSNVWTKLYRRTRFRGLFFIKGIYFEDVPFTVMALTRARSIMVTDLPIYYYYQNPNSIMRSAFTLEKARSYLKLIRAIHTFISLNRPELLGEVRERILNRRFKMMLNQSVRKQKERALLKRIFNEVTPEVKALAAEGIISGKGLKWYHRVALRLMRQGKSDWACRWMRLLKG